jgi:hypothetical protein
MKHLILAGLALVAMGAGAPAYADEAERLALARQIVATRSEAAEMQFFEASLPYYMATMEQALNLTEQERERLPAMLREEYRAALIPSRERSAQTYVRIFTEEDLREVVAFYQSSAGRKFLDRQTEIQQDSIELQRVMNAAVLQNTAERLMEGRQTHEF